MHSILYNNISLPYSHLSCEPFASLSLKSQALERIERYFEKWMITDMLVGIGQPTKEGIEIGC